MPRPSPHNNDLALCEFLQYSEGLNEVGISCQLPNAEFYFPLNRPRSIYQYSNMGPRLSGLTSIFGVVFFVSKSPVGIERQKKLEKFAILTRKPRSHA